MKAIFRSGSQQFSVAVGDTIDVQLLRGQDAGAEVKFDNVYMIIDGDNVKVGTPQVSGATVTAKIVSEVKGQKLRWLWMRRRKHSRRQGGHRQHLHRLEITDING